MQTYYVFCHFVTPDCKSAVIKEHRQRRQAQIKINFCALCVVCVQSFFVLHLLRPQVLRRIHPGGFQDEGGRDCPYDEEHREGYDEEHREGAAGEEPPRQLNLDGEELEERNACPPRYQRADKGGRERNLQQIEQEEALYVGYRGSVDDADGYLGVAAADFVADVGDKPDERDEQDARAGEEDAVAHVLSSARL